MSLCIGSGSGSAGEEQDCGSCFHVSLTVVIAVVVCDILLTVFITAAVVCSVRSRRRRRERSEAAPASAAKRTSTEATESPYQELQGVQSDVYSELQHFRK